MTIRPFLTERIGDDNSLAYYLSKISKHRTLAASEEGKLAQRMRQGDRKALEELVQCNLRFVVSVTRNYQNQGLPLSDLINEGNLGLIRAAKRFDEKKNFKFISYAVWWIRQAILQALAEQSRIVKLPLNRVGTLHKIGKTQGRLEQKFNRLPNIEEIAKELDLDERVVQESIKIGNSHMSLDAPVRLGQEDDTKLLDIIQNNQQEDTDEGAMQNSLNFEIDQVLSKLTEREKEVIKLYFGIGEDTAHTLEEIGIRFALTRERVRQIKEKAIKRLKQASKKTQLKAFSIRLS